MLVLIDGEIRSLFRNALERFIGAEFPMKKNKHMEALNRLCIRVISSLIAVQIFRAMIDVPGIQEFVTTVFVGLFIYLNVIHRD